jgi:1-deoxy-D-xylulose-5-phosphate reductoisomerase
MSDPEWVTVLGATGSIGQSTLDVIARHADRYRLFAITANTQVEKLLQQCLEFTPCYAVMKDEDSAQLLQEQLQKHDSPVQVLAGEQALCQVAAEERVATVMAAIVGAAGLEPTMAAVAAGKKVLLANKEALVMAGQLFMDAVQQAGAVLLPIDSEHNAIFQCMPLNYSEGLHKVGVNRILLTGSGGPFRQRALSSLKDVTPDQACAHPNWSMGRKISVDSATMMNKGLELIEACWLFATSPEKIDVVVHPQSVIHSMVEYVDGSVLAQLGNPDMRTPIAHGLAWPARIDSGVGSLDIIATARLDFEAPDYARFPCLRLAIESVRAGGTAMVTLNAANEIAVDAFLHERIRFTQIDQVVEWVLEQAENNEPHNMSVVKNADHESRLLARSFIERLN